MSLDLQRFDSRAEMPTGVKQLFLDTPNPGLDELEYVPRYYCEARIDFADVRSGLRKSCSVSRALEIYPSDNETLWTEDMVWDINPAHILSMPARQGKMRSLPPFVNRAVISKIESAFFSYVVRFYEVRLFRNFAVGVYSGFGESIEDFRGRCVELLSESFRRDIDSLRDVFNRRLELLKAKYIRNMDWIEPDQEKSGSLNLSRLHNMAEWLADLFLRTQFSLNFRLEVPPVPMPNHGELEEQLVFFKSEAVQGINRSLQVYQDKACNIDEYIIRPTIKDIRLVRTCILWMPAGVRQQ